MLKNKKGYTLIETMITISLITVIAISAFQGYNFVLTFRYKTNIDSELLFKALSKNEEAIVLNSTIEEENHKTIIEHIDGMKYIETTVTNENKGFRFKRFIRGDNDV